MKKIVSILLALVLLIGATGCSGADEEKNKKLKKDLYSIYEELRPVYNSDSSNTKVRDYIAGIADRQEIYNLKLPGDNLLLMKKADPQFEGSPSATLQCSISSDNRKEDAQAAAIALSVLENVENHGQITVLFTGEENEEFYGAQSLANTYLKTDNFINLKYSSKASLITGSACMEEYTLSSKAETASSGTGKAFHISIRSEEGRLSVEDRESYPNPIMTLGLLLSGSRNNGINLRIASFDGEISSGKNPIYAEAVVVIQPDDEERFMKRVESSIDSLGSKHSNATPRLDYEISPTDMPKSTLSHDSTSRLLSLIYTIDDGMSTEKEDDVLAFSDLEKISVSKNIDLEVVGRSTSEEEQKKFRGSYENIAKLNGYSFSPSLHNALWESPEKNVLAESLTIAAGQNDLKLKPSSSLQSNECSIFTTNKEDLQAVSFGVNIQQGYEISKSLTMFLESLHQSKV